MCGVCYAGIFTLFYYSFLFCLGSCLDWLCVTYDNMVDSPLVHVFVSDVSDGALE